MKQKSRNAAKRILTFMLTLAMVLGAIPLPFVQETMVVQADEEWREITNKNDLQGAVENGGKVRLGADMVLLKYLDVPKGTTVTLDLNGHVLGNYYATATARADGFLIYVSGTLTIMDSGTTPRYGHWTSGGYALTTTEPESDNYDTFPNGGVITGGNGGYQDSAGVNIGSTGKLILESGAIAGNKGVPQNTGYLPRGGGMHIAEGGEVIMNGGVIAGNNVYGKKEKNNGGGVYNEGTFTMNDGTIRSNRANGSGNSGGGVLNLGSFIMNGGTIEKNSSDKGGGISNGTFGGVLLNGGVIQNNTASVGGGIYCYNAVTRVSGTPVVRDNWSGDQQNNMYIKSPTKLRIDGELTEDACIGIRLSEDYGNGVFTEGLSQKGTNENFTSDDTDYVIGLVEGEAAVRQGQEPPTAGFVAQGADCGVLSDVADSMQYSLDGGSTWLPISGESETIASGVTAEHGIKVKKLGDGTTFADSPAQFIEVTKAKTPELIVKQPATPEELGSIPTTEAYEYSTDNGKTWNICNGAITGLAIGTKLDVRVRAKDMTLASDAQTIEILRPIMPWEKLADKLDNVSTDANDPTKITLTEDVIALAQDGTLVIPEGTYVEIDLAGHTIDRALKDYEKNGNVITVNGTLTIKDSSEKKSGAIIGGKTKVTPGGGIYVGETGKLTLEGGTIAGNSASQADGGGVYVDSNATFVMSGGVITGNTAPYGSGVYVKPDGTFVMSGGAIIDNTVNGSGNSGGVHIYDGGKFYISGNPVIDGNQDADSARADVYLDGTQMTVTSALGKDAYISVMANENGIVAQADEGYAALTGEDAKKFHSGDEKYMGAVNADGKVAFRKAFAVTVTNGKGADIYTEGISVTVTSDAPEEGRLFKEWTADGITLTDAQKKAENFTFTMPANEVHLKANYKDIETLTAPVFTPGAGTYSSAQNVEISCETTDADIYYTTNGETPSSDSTKYTGAISVTQNTTIKAIAFKTGMYHSTVATAEYIINKDPKIGKTPTAVTNLVYDGNGHELINQGEAIGGTLYYAATKSDDPAPDAEAYAPSVPRAVEAGSYTVWYWVKGDANYNSTTPDKVSPIVIAPAKELSDIPETSMNVPTDCKKIGEVTLPNDWKWSEKDKDKEIAQGETVTATAFYDGKDKENYTEEARSVTIQITRTACTHSYTDPVYTWSEDYGTCTAVMKCSQCGEEVKESVSSVSENTIATCEKKGTVSYTATFTKEGFTTQTKIVETPALEHVYTEPDYKWSEDGKTCTATVVCKLDGCTDSTEGHRITENAVITASVKADATADRKGITTYTATFKNPLFSVQTKDIEDIPVKTEVPKVGTEMTVADAKAIVTVISTAGGGSAVKYEATTEATAKNVKIPNNVVIGGVTYAVTEIADGAFRNNKSLTNITIGNNVEAIGDNAFAGCKNLTTITIPKGVKKIGKYAFKGNKKLKKIIVKTTKLTDKSVAKKAFSGVGKKVVIKVPKSKKKVYEKLFRKKGLNKKVKIK